VTTVSVPSVSFCRCDVPGGGGEGEASTGFWWGNLRERDHWGDPDIDERIILRSIFKKYDVGCGLDWGGSG
jgi:hypothetical protein